MVSDREMVTFSEVIGRARNGTLAASDQYTGALPSDGSNDWLAHLLDQKILHDKNYIVFGKLTPEMGSIIDVGANYGYSATSIRSAGCECPIFSIEALPTLAPHLQFMKEKLGGSYDFTISAVGSERGILRLLVPVVNDTPLTALSSANPSTFGNPLLNNIVNYCTEYMAKESSLQLRFSIQDAPVEKIDALLPRNTGLISAIKFDVEGHEYEAMMGAQESLVTYAPLLLVESIDRDPKIETLARKLGYVPSTRVEARLSEIPTSGDNAHAFYFHRSNIDRYKEIGIL